MPAKALVVPRTSPPSWGLVAFEIMCGRYTVTKDQQTLSLDFGSEFSESHLPTFNASPGQHLPVILDVESCKIQLALWGIIAELQRRPRRMLINARGETVDRLPTFRNAFRQRRCLVIADGFYEWQATRFGKQPYRIVLNTDEPFAFAGIWVEHRGEPAYVILTTEPNDLTRPIHDRMPVILERNERAMWLDGDRPVRDALKLLDPYPEGLMRAYPVSKAVNNSSNQGRELIAPAIHSPDPTGSLFD